MSVAIICQLSTRISVCRRIYYNSGDRSDDYQLILNFVSKLIHQEVVSLNSGSDLMINSNE